MTARTLSPTDRYPSRAGTEQKFIKRGDPVLWGPKQEPLDQAELEQFHHNGFVVLDGVLDPDTVAEAMAEMQRLSSDPELLQSNHAIPDPETGDFRTLFAVHNTSPMFEWLAADARLADVARQLLDDDVYIHQSILEVKGPLSTHATPWHSEFETWHVEDGIPAMRTTCVSVALTDNHAWTGPLTMISGSHGWYLSYEGDRGRPPDATELSWLLKRGEMETFAAPAGSVLFYDSNLMVGAPNNISPLPRTNVFLAYNSMENTPEEPFGDSGPRPSHIATVDPTPLPSV